MILIESQWNLNGEEQGKNGQEFDILIESQWNLNDIIPMILDGSAIDINRITVEFKCTSSTVPSTALTILIESQWNLNELICFCGIVSVIYINRITVEFKLYRM